MIRLHVHNRIGRKGLTLMELVVVMVILVALGGIIVGLLPSMLSRAHNATDATNLPEIAKVFTMYEALYQGYPDSYDSLLRGPAATAIEDRLPGSASGFYAPLTLTAASRSTLLASGITRVNDHADPDSPPLDFHATFNPYVSPTPRTLAVGGNVASLTAASVLKLGLPATDGQGNTIQYAVFGLGRRCTVVGKMAFEAPTHFADKPAESPNLVYCRYGLVFALGSTATPASKAKLAAVVSFHEDGPARPDEVIEEFYKIQNQQ